MHACICLHHWNACVLLWQPSQPLVLLSVRPPDLNSSGLCHINTVGREKMCCCRAGLQSPSGPSVGTENGLQKQKKSGNICGMWSEACEMNQPLESPGCSSNICVAFTPRRRTITSFNYQITLNSVSAGNYKSQLQESSVHESVCSYATAWSLIPRLEWLGNIVMYVKGDSLKKYW